MMLKTLESADLKGKTVLYRAPYDIEVKEVSGVLEVYDDMRIRATLPTVQYLLSQNCKIAILTYVGRPDGKVVQELRTTPHARKLALLLGRPVDKVDDCVGEEVLARLKSMKEGEILMLENVRFHPGEVEDDDAFAQRLCEGKNIIVFDGFPQAHRRHASTTGILRHLPAVAGTYLAGEVAALSKLLANPERPFTIIIGGAKISDKVDVVNNLLKVADRVLVGGAVANVFLKASGRELGSSFIEDVFVDQKRREKKDWVEYAKEILQKYGDKIVLPKDLVVSDGILTRVVVTTEEIPMGWMALDIGPETQKEFSQIILNSKTVFINGPMGKFEDERFVAGSQALLLAMKEVKGKMKGCTILAGGDTIDMARACGSLSDYTYTSLAGGATLEFLAGKELPALTPLLSR